MKYFLLSISIILISLHAYSQSAKEKADEFYQVAKYKKAIPLYEKYRKSNRLDSLTLFRLGMSYGNNSNYGKAIATLKTAIEDKFYPGYTYGQIARFAALLKSDEELYSSIDSLLKYNPSSFALIKKDSVFEEYLKINTFTDKLALMETKSYPCLSNEKSRLFDFWIGKWNVIASGRKAGINVITRATGGCAIHESYTTSGAYSGQSINFLDPEDNLWKQYWVGSSGDVYSFSEVESTTGKIVFLAKSTVSENETWTRLTFTHDLDKDEVTQLFESSSDLGKTWAPGFNGLYRKID
ncbi:MAG: hypothetical protein AAFQ94_06250 [Bacteroidota bacterium]